MRVFLALDLPAAAKAELDRRARGAAGGLPPARWVRPATMHLTLVFLGEIAEATVAPLAAGLAPVFAARPPLVLRFREVGGFPPRGPARVVWAGLDADGDLAGLQRDAATVASAVAAVEPEGRPFHPHLTLARCRPPWPRPAVARLAAAVDLGGALAAPMPVAAGTLYASELRPDGAVYRELARLPFTARGDD